MADFNVHVQQADHNKAVSVHLLGQESFHDWAITAAFYSAIHYFEAWIFNRPEKHCEENVPVNEKGEARFTVHAWREKLVFGGLSKEAFRAYRQLREASETARYLSLPRATTGNKWSTRGAWIFFSTEQAKILVLADLKIFEGAVDLELARFLHQIDFESTIGITAPLIRQRLIADYGTKAKLLAEKPDEIKRKYGPGAQQAFINAAREKSG